MESSPVEVKQEVGARASGVGSPLPLTRFSTSVTTGQGGPYAHARPGKVRALGNNRAPIPTCGILVSHGGPNITMSGAGESEKPSASAKLADTMLGGAKVDSKLFNASRSGESGSLASAHDHASVPPAVSEDCSFQESDASIPSEEDLEVEAQPRQTQLVAPRRTRKGKEKKKVGRPIAYKGDPNDPDLTESERRRIKRRIANRESARRVRHKRQEVLEEMQIKMEQLHAQNSSLKQRAMDLEAQKAHLAAQVAELESKHRATVDENLRMQQEVLGLRQSLDTKLDALAGALDEQDRAVAAPVPEPPARVSAFSEAAAQVAETGDDNKTPLDWFPSMTLEDMPSGIEPWDMINTLLPVGSGPAAAAAPRGRALC